MKSIVSTLVLSLLAAIPGRATLRTGGDASAITASISEADIKAVVAGILYSGAAEAGDYFGQWYYRQSYYKPTRFDIDLLDGDRLSASIDLNVRWNTNLSLIQLDKSETAKGNVTLRRPFRIAEENNALILNFCTDDIESVNVTVPYVNWLYDWDSTARAYLARVGCVKIGSFSNNLPLVPSPLRKGAPAVTVYNDRVELKYDIRHYPFNILPALFLLLQ